MTIENLTNIIGGTIINQPKVAKVDAATIYQSKVELGDLFFALSSEDIVKAVEKGAYAVVFEGANPQITDSEIAYIKVDSIKDASIKFLRYILVQKESQIYYFEDIESSFLKQIVNRKSSIYTILSNNWQKSFETILNSNYEIYITINKEDASALSPNYKTLTKEASGYIISDSLLKTTFKIEKYIYQNMDIAPFFVDNLKKVVAFCKDNDIEYDINRIKYTSEFKPYYVDKKLNLSQKGSTEQVLIFVNSTKIVDKSIKYLRLQSKWIKSIVLTPPKIKLETIERATWYKTPQEAKEILLNNHFNYAFCYKLEPKEIININGEDGLTLF